MFITIRYIIVHQEYEDTRLITMRSQTSCIRFFFVFVVVDAILVVVNVVVVSLPDHIIFSCSRKMAARRQ